MVTTGPLTNHDSTPSDELTPEAAEDLIRRYRHLVPAERALLAATDPAGEADALYPLSEVRARQVLLQYAEAEELAQEAMARRRSSPAVIGRREDGRDLLTRLGADPNRARGVIRCPGHEDRAASLSWRLANDGRALLHCFAGCTFAEILAAAA